MKTNVRSGTDEREPVCVDLKTIAHAKKALSDARVCLRPEQIATMRRATLAERILQSAAQVERDREHLLDAALNGLAA
jgi:hypothetical protein